MPIWLQMARSYNNPESVNYKIAYLREQIGDAEFGKLAFEDQVQLAMLGETIIVGGFLKTELIKAKSIVADQLNVDDLSAITGKFTSLMAGNPFGTRLELGESAGEPFLEAYDDGGELRVRLLQDRLQFYTNDFCGGEIRAKTLSKDDEDYHILYVSADNHLSMSSGWDLNITSGHEITIAAADESAPDKAALIMLETLGDLWSNIYLMASDNIVLDAGAVWIEKGLFHLRDPAGSTNNKQIDFTGGYSLRRDDAGAGGNNTRLWLDTPHAGEVVVGPRAGADYLGQIRIRTLEMRVETGSTSRYLRFWGPTEPRMEPSADNIGYVGSVSKAFRGMHAYNYNQASARDAKINLELADRVSCYDQVRGLNFWGYNLKADVENVDADDGSEQGKDGESAAAAPVYLGVITDESPDIICDPEKKNINLYSYISLIGAALQETQRRLEALEDKLLERER